MIFYIFFAFCVTSLLSLGYLFPNKKNKIQWLVFFIAVCLSGFRDYVGVDFAKYVDWYIKMTRDDGMEVGYVAVMKLFRALNLSYHSLFFLFSFLTCLFVFLGIKKYTLQTNLAFLIFLLLPGLYLNSFSLIRQSFSVSICFFAFYFLMTKKYVIYLILMLVGIGIHNSSILPFLVFPLVFKYAKYVNVKHIGIMLFVSLLLSKLHFIQMFSFLFEHTHYSYYFLDQRVSVNLYKTIVINVIAFFVLFHFKEMKIKYPNQEYFMILYFSSIIFMNLFSDFADMARLADYFIIFEIIVVADFIYLMTNRRMILLLVAFYIYYFSAFLYTLKGDLLINSKSKLIPYKTYIKYSEFSNLN